MSPKKRQRLSLDGRSAPTAYDVESISHEEQPEPTTPKIKSLFVHSLPTTATTASLTEHFSQSFALKHATVVTDPATQKSRGYGFVTFTDAEDAQNARKVLNRSTYQGKKIKVDLAEPRHRVPHQDDSATSGIKGVEPRRLREQNQLARGKPPKLIVRNLPWSIKEGEQLALLFRSYGKVKHATMPKKATGLSAGYGFVTLRGAKNAEKALKEMNGKEVDGRQLAVDYAIDKAVWETLQEKGDAESANVGVTKPPKDDSSVKSEDDVNLYLHDVATSEGKRTYGSDAGEASSSTGDEAEQKEKPKGFSDPQSTLFIRNVPFDTTDEMIMDHFAPFGPVRYGRVVTDPTTGRSRGTAFVCFYSAGDADKCLRNAPKIQSQPGQAMQPDEPTSASLSKRSLLENTGQDPTGKYILQDRVLHVSRAVDRGEARRLTIANTSLRDSQDNDKRRLYLLSEGTVSASSPLYGQLPPSELKFREDSARQRQTLIKSNPALHLSLTRLSVRNVPRTMTSKGLKELARKAVVGFASDVKAGIRRPLSKEELARGGEELKKAEKDRKIKGKGIVRQAKIVFEGLEGSKIREDSGAARSRGYGFIEYTSHRCALMGLRWLNGHPVEEVHRFTGTSQNPGVEGSREKLKRLIIEFAIENAQVVGRRREREAKARERSGMIDARQTSGQMPPAKPDQKNAAAKILKGTKRSGDFDAGTSQPPALKPTEKTQALSKRQQIIGRKRKMRQSRRTGHVGR